jgi:Tfp pilus assembly protein FimT
LGIVLAIAAPNFNKYRQNTNLREAARDLASDISFWRQRAVADNVHYRITFNQATNRYTILQGGQLSTDPYIPLVPAVTKSPSNISSGVIISDLTHLPNQWVTFEPRGTMSAGSLTLQHTIRLSTATITTYFTGRVGNVAYILK